jgi:hypothetical protein
MSRHSRVDTQRILPKQRGRQVDGVESSQLGGHGLRGAIEHNRVYLYQLKRVNQDIPFETVRGWDYTCRCLSYADSVILACDVAGLLRARPRAIEAPVAN